MIKALENINTVLIVRSGALGEMIFGTALIAAVVKQFGNDVKIDWLGAPVAASLFRRDPRIHRIFPLKHRKVPLLLSKQKKAVVDYSDAHPYDLLINLEQGEIFHPLIRRINARYKYGLPYNQIIGLPKPHVIESLRTISQEIIEPDILDSSYPKLFGEALDQTAEKFSLPEKYIVLVPSNSHHNRNKINHRAWPAEYWKSVIHKLYRETTLVIIGNKGEEEFFEAIKPYPTENVIDLVGKTTLPELISVIEMATLMLSTDTGPSHIASAVNTPVFAMIGPTDYTGTGPFKTPLNYVEIITKNLPCSPCYPTGEIKTCQDNLCMKQITPDEVYDRITAYLSKDPANAKQPRA